MTPATLGRSATARAPWSGRRRAGVAAPAAVGAATVLAAWLIFGVRPAEVVLFVGYEVGFVLVPGVLLRLALGGRDEPWRERLALGWALGLALELGAFAATAALDARGWFPLFPLPVYAVGGAMLVRARRSAVRPAMAVGNVVRGLAPPWSSAAAAILIVVSLALGFFAFYPPARGVESVTYPQDLVFHLSLSADAMHHWPVGDPSVGGRELKYHLFANYDMAAISQTTGIPLDVLLLRLWPVAALLAIALLIANVTRLLGGTARTALLAVGLTMLVGELDVDTRQGSVFLGGDLLMRLESPSFLFGAVFFLAALQVVLRLMQATTPSPEAADGRPPRQDRWRSFVLLAILLTAASGAKASVLPVLLGGLGLQIAMEVVRRRRVSGQVIGLLGLTAALFVTSYVVLYAGGGEGGFGARLLDFGRYIAPGSPEVPRDAAALLSLPVMLLPLLGLLGFAAAKGRPTRDAERLILGLLAAALGAFLVFAQPGGSQMYFLLYGYLAAIPLSAYGLQLSRRQLAASSARVARALAPGLAALFVAAGVGAVVLGSFDKPSTLAALTVAYALIALAAGAAVLLTRRNRLGGRQATLAACLCLVFALGTLDLPLDAGSRLAPRWANGQHAWTDSDPSAERGLDSGLRDALTWVETRTPASAILAVNNFFTFDGVSRYFYYSAFAERRIYIQGWGYTPEGVALLQGKQLPPWMVIRVRASLGAAVGIRNGFDVLKRDHVRYLLVDKYNSRYANTDAIDPVLEPAFENEAAAVYDLAGWR